MYVREKQTCVASPRVSKKQVRRALKAYTEQQSIVTADTTAGKAYVYASGGRASYACTLKFQRCKECFLAAVFILQYDHHEPKGGRKMDFGNQIRELRKRSQLTQSEFADRMNVTRQAVSNWENNKNLPDLQTVIRISEEFDISLDDLIKGGQDNMNNMTEKLIRDGDEGRRTRHVMISSVVGALLMLAGLACFVIKALSFEYVDSQGILHENFFLLPVGYMFLFAGFAVLAVSGIRSLIKWKRDIRHS